MKASAIFYLIVFIFIIPIIVSIFKFKNTKSSKNKLVGIGTAEFKAFMALVSVLVGIAIVIGIL